MRERRAVSREPRRIHLVFWDRWKPEDRRNGFTSDASVSGVFVQTHRPLRSGTRIQMEVDLNPGSFFLEGLVVRSVSVPPDLRKVKPGGMGVRLLGIDALLHELHSKDPAPSRPTPAGPAVEASKPPADEAAAKDEGEPAPGRPARKTVFERDPTEVDPARLHPAASPVRRVESDEGESGADERPPPPARQARPETFAVAFESFDALRQTYERELMLGGLFVPTDSPAAVGSTISISLQLPLGRGTIDATARVVQTLHAGSSAIAGMGIVIDDAAGFASDLREILESA
ncbi:MAG TPA: hypothetical protein VMT85_18955 [Thermoanaerobaculia bacterium]|nr:hypothetical protein [Thermoanaerobaculia bacterium]